jgi:HK97 family phage portal protein
MRIPFTGLTVRKENTVLAPVDNRGMAGWFSWIIGERYSGAWQRDDEIRVDTIIQNPTIFACVTLIASDIGKLALRLRQQTPDGIWQDTTSPAYTPVLTRPNAYQNQIQFKEAWLTSKLLRGNTYVLKQRDGRGVVTQLYVLDPSRVIPLVTPAGDIFYQLANDNLAGLQQGTLTVPASEIIHDRMNCIFHPLVGLSPIFAAGLPAYLAQKATRNSVSFFENGGQPGGILTAPGNIDPESAQRVKDYFEQNYTGRNAGKIAVVGDGLKYERLTMSSADSQMLEQLKWTDEKICSAFHMPGFKVGVGVTPTYSNGELANRQYYDQCLQTLIESLELCLTEGLAADPYRIELDLKGLLRMDTQALWTSIGKARDDGLLTVNEARRELGYPPVDGGDTIFLQQQNFSLEALAKRDALPNPFVIDQPTTTPDPAVEPSPAADAAAAKWYDDFTKALRAELTT